MIDVKGKRVLILGLGRSGAAAARFAARAGGEVYISETASKDEIAGRLMDLRLTAEEVETGGHTKDFCTSCQIVIASPGVDTISLAERGLLTAEQEVIGELEFAWGFSPAYTIAVTGTNGKSTTCSLIAEILKEDGRDVRLCGNIGTPLSEVAGDLKKGSVAVVEVSSFQLQTVRDFAPNIGVLLNIETDHLKRHGDVKRYAETKFKMFASSASDDWAVIHDSLKKAALRRGVNARSVFYGARSAGGPLRISASFAERRVRMEFQEEAISLKGLHNRDNIEAAVLTALISGCSEEAIERAVRSFKSLTHRFQHLGRAGGVDFIDDSKATNIDAAVKAVRSVSGKLVLIAGGKDKGDDYGKALPDFRGKVKTAIVIGEAGTRIKEALESGMPVVFAESMEEAVEKAFSIAADGETVLLSPMCSSFDMYDDYAHRGRVFTQAVSALSERIHLPEKL